MRQIRVLPLVMVASGAMLAIKFSGIALGIAPGTQNVRADMNPQPMPPVISKQIDSDSAEILTTEGNIVVSHSNPPAIDTIVTGQVVTDTDHADKINETIAAGKEPEKKSFFAGSKYVPDPNNPIYQRQEVLTPEEIESFASNSPARAALLERLQERHTKLQAKEGAIGVQQKLLEAAEKRLTTRIDELKSAKSELDQKLIQKEKEKDDQFAGVVKMYESMKPKNAARIFNTLEMSVLLDVAKRIKPRIMAEILGFMEPLSAQRLTIALAKGMDSVSMNNSQNAQLTTQSISNTPRALPKIGQ